SEGTSRVFNIVIGGVFGVDTHMAFSQGETTPGYQLVFLRAGASRQQSPLRLRRRTGSDIDDAVNSVGAPERGAGAADHFNALHILQHQVLSVPENPGKQR